MKAYGVNELRRMFLDFFESKGHLKMKSFSLGYHSLFHFAFLHKCKLCVKTIITFYQLNIYYRFRFCAFL